MMRFLLVLLFAVVLPQAAARTGVRRGHDLMDVEKHDGDAALVQRECGEAAEGESSFVDCAGFVQTTNAASVQLVHSEQKHVTASLLQIHSDDAADDESTDDDEDGDVEDDVTDATNYFINLSSGAKIGICIGVAVAGLALFCVLKKFCGCYCASFLLVGTAVTLVVLVIVFMVKDEVSDVVDATQGVVEATS